MSSARVLGNVGEVGVPAVPEAWQPVGHGMSTRLSAISASDSCTAGAGSADGVLPANGWVIGGAGAGACACVGAGAGIGAAEATGANDDAAAGCGGFAALGSGCCSGGGGACCVMSADGWVGASSGAGCGCGWVDSGVCPCGNDDNGCSFSLTRQRLVGEGRISVKWDL